MSIDESYLVHKILLAFVVTLFMRWWLRVPVSSLVFIYVSMVSGLILADYLSKILTCVVYPKEQIAGVDGNGTAVDETGTAVDETRTAVDETGTAYSSGIGTQATSGGHFNLSNVATVNFEKKPAVENMEADCQSCEIGNETTDLGAQSGGSSPKCCGCKTKTLEYPDLKLGDFTQVKPGPFNPRPNSNMQPVVNASFKERYRGEAPSVGCGNIDLTMPRAADVAALRPVPGKSVATYCAECDAPASRDAMVSNYLQPRCLQDQNGLMPRDYEQPLRDKVVEGEVYKNRCLREKVQSLKSELTPVNMENRQRFMLPNYVEVPKYVPSGKYDVCNRGRPNSIFGITNDPVKKYREM